MRSSVNVTIFIVVIIKKKNKISLNEQYPRESVITRHYFKYLFNKELHIKMKRHYTAS